MLAGHCGRLDDAGALATGRRRRRRRGSMASAPIGFGKPGLIAEDLAGRLPEALAAADELTARQARAKRPAHSALSDVRAGVVELVDTRDLGSRAARRGGSSPFARTRRKRWK